MSKKVLLVLSIIALVLCIMCILITVFCIPQVPTLENTTVYTFTVEYVKKVNSVATHIGVKENDYELAVFNELVSNWEVFSSLSLGDTITVRKYTKNSAGEVWELSANGVNIVSLDDSMKFADENYKSILPVGIVFDCLFAVASIVCFCGYKGVFNKRKV
ncbi:MAG: hypothetical protein K2M64_01140 [Clostridia bacterium]|nr:hypothetical protein [Clostridia bacterium]